MIMRRYVFELPLWLRGKKKKKICLQWRRRGFEFWVWKNPLEKEMSAHFSILAWEIPWTEEPCQPQSMGLQELDMAKWLSHHHVHPCLWTMNTYVSALISYGTPSRSYWWSWFTPSMTVNLNCLYGWCVSLCA